MWTQCIIYSIAHDMDPQNPVKSTKKLDLLVITVDYIIIVNFNLLELDMFNVNMLLIWNTRSYT